MIKRFVIAGCVLWLAGCAAPMGTPDSSASLCVSALVKGLPDGLYQAVGEGANQVQAIDQALSTIARQVRVAIRAEAISTQAKRDGAVSQHFQKQVSSVSDQVFDDYRLLCADPVTYTVVVEYDHRPLAVRLANRLEAWWGGEGWLFAWAPDLQVDAALAALGERSGLSPVSVAVTLQRDRDGWYLQLNERRLNLRLQEWRAFYSLPPANRGGLAIKLVNTDGATLDHSVNPGTEFRFSVTGLGGTQRYLSIMALDAQGKVVPVRSNVPLAGGDILIPDAPGVFSAELPAGAPDSVDDYLVLLSTEPQTLPQSLWYFDGWHHLVNRYDSLGLRVVVR